MTEPLQPTQPPQPTEPPQAIDSPQATGGGETLADPAPATPPGQRFPIVGIGASAGGLEALRKFFTAMPDDKGIGFVVIVHLAPEKKSHFAELLSSVTRMPIKQAEEGDEVLPDHVYVIPPSSNLRIEQGRLHLSPLSRRPAIPLPINHFLCSLAEDRQELAVSIILTGGDGDGTLGSKEIKAADGMVMVQTPETAQHPNMPNHTIAAGVADFVLPVEEMPAALIRYIEHAALAGDAAAEAADEDDLDKILGLLHLRAGHDFRCYKKAMLMRRVRRRMGLRQVATLADYQAHLRANTDELQALCRDLLIGVTEFFREPEGWRVLEQEVLPALFDDRGRDLRIWVPGCSTGEEAYTLGMLLTEQQVEHEHRGKISIFATDINREALEIARLGRYPESIASSMAAKRLSRFFYRSGDEFQVKKDLREMMLFAPQSLVADPPFSQLDLISCHNLLIYLDTELHKKVIELFHFSLNPDGYLFLGKSESIGQQQTLFKTVSAKWRIYQSVVGARRTPVDFPLAREPFAAAVSRPARPPSTAGHAAKVRDHLLARYAPAAVLIDRNQQVLYFHGNVADYLSQPAGTPTGDLLSMTRDGVRVKLRAALGKAVADNRPVKGSASLSGRNGPVAMEFTVLPLNEPQAAGQLLVTFEQREQAQGEQARGEQSRDGQARDGRSRREQLFGADGQGQPAAHSEEASTVRHLEEELRDAQAETRGAIEDLETANEELKVGNEEAMSMNEELQSANEELETSKEELQSLNEELSTVNTQVEEKLHEVSRANNDLSNLLTSTNIATLFLDRDLNIKRYTPAATRLFHVIASDIGRPIAHIGSRFEGSNLIERARAVLDHLVPDETEVVSDAGRYYIRRIQPYRTDDDRIDGVVVTFVDVTELKHGAEQARRLASVVRDSSDAITVLDFSGRISAWNRGAQRMYGYSEAEAIGMNISALVLPDDLRSHEEHLRRANEHFTARRITRDGRVLDVDVTQSVLRDDAGAPVALATTERDMTERRLDELRATTERLQAADRRKDEFLAMLAHELRNPLAPIRNAAEALGDRRITRAQMRVARDVIDRQVRHMTGLIDDLLDVSRITRGMVMMRHESVELKALIERAVEANQSLIDARRHNLSVQVPATPVWLEGDSMRLVQVLGNLLNNAVKYTDEGGDISVTATTEDGQAVLRVRDSGIGMAAELLPHVFDLFVQGERALDRSQGGLGVGLRLVYQLVRMHGGTIVARSDGPGLGSEFEVRLPLTVRAADLPHLTLPVDDVEMTLLPSRGLRTLVVDDNVDTVESMAALLAMQGHEARTAIDGETAIEVARSFRPQAVLVDVGLPDIDGYEVARRLREMPETAGALLLAVTGYGKAEDRRRSKEAGFDYHLVKPVELASVLGLLRAQQNE